MALRKSAGCKVLFGTGAKIVFSDFPGSDFRLINFGEFFTEIRGVIIPLE